MKRDGTPAKYELIEYDGHNEKYQGKMVRLYDDGCIRDERGYMIEPHPGRVEITHENSRIYRELHYQQMQEAAADAISREIGSISPFGSTPAGAWGVLNARTAQQIMDSNIPRGFDLMQLGQNMGAIPREKELEQPAAAPAGISVAALKAIHDIVEEVNKARDRLDADIVDAE